MQADPRLLEMGRLLIHDSLTGVYNRRYFTTRLGAEPGLVAAEQRWAAASQGIYR